MKKTKDENKGSIEGVDKSKSGMIALKDHHLFCPPKVDIKIKKDDDLTGKIPEKFHQTLITEGVLKGNK